MAKPQVKHLSFSKESHLYTVDGLNCPGVSSILEENGLTNYNGVHQSVLEAASEFGDQVHKMTVLWDRSVLDVESLHPDLMGWLESWRRFCQEQDFQIDLIEAPVYSDKYYFIGTADRRGKTKKYGRVIVDIKTCTTVSPAHKLQACAYKIANNEGIVTGNDGLYEWTQNARHSFRVDTALICQLFGDGRYLYYRVDQRDELAFIAAATLTNWRTNNKVKGLKG